MINSRKHHRPTWAFPQKLHAEVALCLPDVRWGKRLSVALRPMGKTFECLSEQHIAWLLEQKLFFVASAANGGHVNVSPKGWWLPLLSMAETNGPFLSKSTI